ncbi:MAG: FecR domain-containing protein [Bacteroidia bacterium]|nr:FecR domain-containing protein [Bacteroidia bacterium]
MKNYDTYFLEDFVADEAFCRWVLYDEGPEAELDGWLKKNPSKVEMIEEAKEMVRSLKFKDSSIDEELVSRLWGRIEESTSVKATKVRPLRSPMRYSLAIAAGLALIFALYFLLKPGDIKVYKAAQGETLALTLSDGSEVVLNSGSSLSYSRESWKEGTREVMLDGEAYFSVVKGKGRFSVQSSIGDLVVLGTKFNVFDRQGAYTVRVFEGRVSVKAEEVEKKELTKGYQSEFTQGSDSLTVKTFSFEEESYKDWRAGYFEYKGASLEKVMEEIGRRYGKELVLDSSLMNLDITTTFDIDEMTLERVMENVTFSHKTKLDYQIEREKIVVTKK